MRPILYAISDHISVISELCIREREQEGSKTHTQSKFVFWKGSVKTFDENLNYEMISLHPLDPILSYDNEINQIVHSKVYLLRSSKNAIMDGFATFPRKYNIYLSLFHRDNFNLLH